VFGASEKIAVCGSSYIDRASMQELPQAAIFCFK
jgi:hypothetical protein